MPIKRLKKYLNENKVKYVSVKHSPAYTAQEIAAEAHVPGKALAKTVMVKVDGKMAMCVLPASYKVDFAELKQAASMKDCELATEKEFQEYFPESELGAMPPFGNLYDMDTYVAESLTVNEEIAFNAGSHTELLKMEYAAYESLVQPKIVKFSFKQLPGKDEG
ncbi:aminoacyl-tRNA deacylase [Gemmatimonadota bacterium]